MIYGGRRVVGLWGISGNEHRWTKMDEYDMVVEWFIALHCYWDQVAVCYIYYVILCWIGSRASDSEVLDG